VEIFGTSIYLTKQMYAKKREWRYSRSQPRVAEDERGEEERQK